jgi:hypothetical protein
MMKYKWPGHTTPIVVLCISFALLASVLWNRIVLLQTINVIENEKRAMSNKKRETKMTHKHLFEILQICSFGLALRFFQVVALALGTILQKSYQNQQNKPNRACAGIH